MNDAPRSEVEVISAAGMTTLANPGVTSQQLLWPGNSPGARVTVTRVTVAPGAGQPRHAHADAEQIWIVEQGRADLLLAGNRSRLVQAGEVVRTPAGEVHGLRNTARSRSSISRSPRRRSIFARLTKPSADWARYSPLNQLYPWFSQ
jgi:quercetin dioxygenase-like cupin family protein